VALITGDGRSLHSDMGKFFAWRVPHDVVSIGRSIKEYPGRVLHWANVDGADSKWWADNLPKRNNGDFPIRHSMGDLPWYDVDWEAKDEIVFTKEDSSWHGSSALFAVYVALALGYEKIILAGCPLDGRGHWWHGPEHSGPRWTGETYQAWLEFSLTPEAEKVRSLSGYTAVIVGNAFKEFCY
jgi:hypothetical protein